MGGGQSTPQYEPAIVRTEQSFRRRGGQAENDSVSYRLRCDFTLSKQDGHQPHVSIAVEAKKETAQPTTRSKLWMWTVDSTNQSLEEFKTVMNMKNADDRVCLFHAYSEDLYPEELRASAPWEKPIREKFEEPLHLTMNPKNVTFHWENLKGRTIREAVVDALEEFAFEHKKPDYLVFGNHTTEISDLAMRSVHVPSVMVKAEPPEDARYFLIAVNHTILCRQGLSVLLSLVRRGDRLKCLYVKPNRSVEEELAIQKELKEALNDEKVSGFLGANDSPIESDVMVRRYYETMLGKFGPNHSEFATVDAGNVSVTDAIIEYTNNENPDFFAITPSSRHELGLIVEQTVLRINASIVLCKV